MSVNEFVNVLIELRGGGESIQEFLSFVIDDDQMEEINKLEFVQSLQALAPDSSSSTYQKESQFMADHRGISSDHQISMENGSLEEMLQPLPQGRPLNKIVEKLANHLQQTGEIVNLDSCFKAAERKQVKVSVGNVKEELCAKKADFQKYLQT